ncbi:MAG TPA: hypothetical protein VHM23_04575 [Actinomycetota bacterium]|nr:hypothetical protein [Actinomycetota bacterium]
MGWVRQAEGDAGTRSDGGLTSAERQELAALRRENQRLRQDVESQAHQASKGRSGAPRIHAQLAAAAIGTPESGWPG